MNKSIIPKFIGVFVSLCIIWLINDELLIDACKEKNGNFDYQKGVCLLENGDVFKTGLEVPLVVVYIVVGFIVTLLVSKLINKILQKSDRET